MFDLGWTEMLLVAAVAIIVVGPKDLPRLMRTIGQFVSKARGMASELQSQFMDIANQSELDEIRKSVTDIKVQNPLEDIEKDLAKATAGENLSSTIDTLDGRDSDSPEAVSDPALTDDYDDMDEWDSPEDVKTETITPPDDVSHNDDPPSQAADEAASESAPAKKTDAAAPEAPKEEAGP